MVAPPRPSLRSDDVPPATETGGPAIASRYWPILLGGSVAFRAAKDTFFRAAKGDICRLKARHPDAALHSAAGSSSA